jgi:serine/threonine-protein kinase
MSQAGGVLDSIVAGKYRVTRIVGRGGMGSVWEGVHTSLNTRVAIKFIDVEHASSKEAQNRFINEARAAAKLRSKHVVQVFDQGITEDGRPYIVMEFLSGEPLDHRLERLGLLSLQETATILGQVCRALAKAHEAGIIHRDLKPENVFIVHDEEDGAEISKVVDFGIAKFTDTSFGMSSATRTGSVLGTPYYMSPEQARGLRSVDHRSDLWSIGVIAYRCVVGNLPFEGEAVGDLLVKICTVPLPVPTEHMSTLPQAFDAWFARALARDPAERFQSASELGEGLLAAAGLRSGRAPLASLDIGRAGYAPAATPWSGPARTPGEAYNPPSNPPPGAATAAPLITQSSPVLPTSSRGLLFAALAVGGGLVVLTLMVLLIRFAVAGSAQPEPATSSSSTPAGAGPSAVVSAPIEVAPKVDPVVDAAAAKQAEQEPEPAKSVAPAESSKPPITRRPGGRPRPKDPNDVLGY